MSPSEAKRGIPDPSTIRRIYLTGFMGAGKSTVGPLLASALKWKFLDLDHLIEAAAGAPVSSIFSRHGEPHFRHLERETLASLRDTNETVIALGGGAVETPGIRTQLATDNAAITVFLEAPLSLLIDRCLAQDGAVSRPVLQDRHLLSTRLEKRLAYYQTAHLTVATENLSPEEAAASILELLGAFARWK